MTNIEIKQILIYFLACSTVNNFILTEFSTVYSVQIFIITLW